MKVLIVEDSMLYRKTIVKYLKEHLSEVEFILAEDGQEGYELYKAENPDFILLDLLIPELSGQELLAKIRAEDQQIKVVVISADVQKIVQEEVKKLGITKFINKPFTEEKAFKLAKMMKDD
ncbi:response regulator [Fuchsiella alkaliacetigena]|uniref:response regulator n=1 Tax=Fuchsiella alkaliacetigena TaxID=957042 RepID=UPI002009F3A5|nr:response regulator [Fuchsiella alkaliacetigena]MCK8826061.1 response regulator [Fuchsiella alkaliacetigena]